MGNNFLNKIYILKPLKRVFFRAFFMLFYFITSVGNTQNTVNKKILANTIKSIFIDGNQIFNISVTTSKTGFISLISTLDGEFQNQFQVVTKEENETLHIDLEQVALTNIADDKRNVHKVIAATINLNIPEQLNLTIFSDIGSVDVKGNFSTLSIELFQGNCMVKGLAKKATINTIDGNISIVTKSAKIEAMSSNGKVITDNFELLKWIWKLKSINGDITVVKR